MATWLDYGRAELFAPSPARDRFYGRVVFIVAVAALLGIVLPLLRLVFDAMI